MKKINLIILAVIGLLLVNVSNATAIFTVVPSSRFITVNNPGSASIIWTVTNNAHITISNLGVNPAYQTSGQASGISLQANTCTGSLMSGASCAFATVIVGANQPANFQVSPQVCGFNGELCSSPVMADRLQVQVVAKKGTAYAYIPAGSNLVSVNGNNFTLGRPLAMEFSTYQGMAVSPNGAIVYIGVYDAANNPALGIVYSGANPGLMTHLPIAHANYLTGLAVSPDNSKIYLADSGLNLVYVINNDNGNYTYAGAISGFNLPSDIVFSNDGKYAYVSNSGTTALSLINVANNTKTDLTDAKCDFESPFDFTMNPDGSTLYIANTGNSKISVMNTSTNTCSASIAVAHAFAITISPDGRYVYVPSSTEPDLTVIDTQNKNESTTYVNVDGQAATAIAVSPDGLKLFIASSGSNAISVVPLHNGLPTGASPIAVDVKGEVKIMVGDKFVGVSG